MINFDTEQVTLVVLDAIESGASIPDLLSVIGAYADEKGIDLQGDPAVDDRIEGRYFKSYTNWAQCLYEGIKSYQQACGTARSFKEFAETGEAKFGITCVLTDDEDHVREEGVNVFDSLGDMGFIESYDLTSGHTDNAQVDLASWVRGPEEITTEVKVWIQTSGDWSNNFE